MSDGLFGTIKSYLPYGVLVYALVGGTNAAQHYDIDNDAANNFIQQLQQQDPSKPMDPNDLMRNLKQTVKVKLPQNLSPESIKVFMDDVSNKVKQELVGDSYGY